MKLILIGLGLHLLVLAQGAENDKKDDKAPVTLDSDPVNVDDRAKRANTEGEVKVSRQTSGELSPEYLNILQQISAQRDQTVAAQQPQLVQQYVLPKDSLKQTARYFLSPDGRLVSEDGLTFLTQPQYVPATRQLQEYEPQTHAEAQAQAQIRAQAQAQAQAQQAQQPRPGVSPEFAEYSRQQQRIQQQYAEAPLRAQIAGGAARSRQQPVTPSSGPNSQSPQVFLPQQQPPSSDPRLRNPLTSDVPSFVYAPIPVDAQALFQHQIAGQLAAAADTATRQIYSPNSRSIVPQQLIYQQPSQEYTQERVIYEQQQPTIQPRRPVSPPPQPQGLPQSLPQQYLIETTRPQPPQAQHQQPTLYVPQEVTQPVQYVQPNQIVSHPGSVSQLKTQPQQYPSTLLQPVSGAGVYDQVKPSRSSIYVSRASTAAAKPVAVESADDPTSPKLPVLRVPIEQRPLTRHELETLVNAGYVSTASVPESIGNYLKSKRQQGVLEESKNHVVYENHQDGVQYQYSPGGPSLKSKKSAQSRSFIEERGSPKAVASGNGPVLTYYLVGRESA